MSVRVWLKPTELGEAGYFIDFDATDYAVRVVKGNRYYLILLGKDEKEVGRVETGRWDAAEIMTDSRKPTSEP